MAAWLKLRGHGFLGARELLEGDDWSGAISWRDRSGYKNAKHRPDLIACTHDRGRVAIKIELTKKSVERLRAILLLHAVWAEHQTGGVICVCADEDGCERVRNTVLTSDSSRAADSESSYSTRSKPRRSLRMKRSERHVCADAERDSSWPAAEKVAMLHAAQKLEAAGPRLGHPHSSAVQGNFGKGFRELRPRAGRSRWRPIYRRVSPSTFAILAVGPEAQIDSGGFDAAVARAVERFGQLELD